MSVSVKDKIVSATGSILEWYDFALYGFFAPIFAQLFFCKSLLIHNLLQAFSIFAIGFIVRPLGAVVFGAISDKYGRVQCLKLSSLFIAWPTLILAILPTYNHIGIFSSILLIVLRIFQGLCIGGEFSNNMVYLCETAPVKKNYFWGSLGSCTGSLGIFLASLSASIFHLIFSPHFLLTTAWRLAFLCSGFMGMIIYT